MLTFSFEKLQLTTEQPQTGECWIPPPKDTPPPRATEKSQQDGRRGEIAFSIGLIGKNTVAGACVVFQLPQCPEAQSTVLETDGNISLEFSGVNRDKTGRR